MNNDPGIHPLPSISFPISRLKTLIFNHKKSLKKDIERNAQMNKALFFFTLPLIFKHENVLKRDIKSNFQMNKGPVIRLLP